VSETPARPQRSVPGMIGAMLVLLLIIGVFVGLRALIRENVAVPPTPVDYLAAAAGAQDLGRTVLYPATLPADWVVTSVAVPRTVEQPWALGMVTDERTFIALRQESLSAQALVRAELGPQAGIAGAIEVAGSVVAGWRRVSSPDESGLVAEHPEGTILVYGTADPRDLRLLAATLTEAPVGAP
jgi:hypothetical protein